MGQAGFIRYNTGDLVGAGASGNALEAVFGCVEEARLDAGRLVNLEDAGDTTNHHCIEQLVRSAAPGYAGYLSVDCERVLSAYAPDSASSKVTCPSLSFPGVFLVNLYCPLFELPGKLALEPANRIVRVLEVKRALRCVCYFHILVNPNSRGQAGSLSYIAIQKDVFLRIREHSRGTICYFNSNGE